MLLIAIAIIGRGFEVAFGPVGGMVLTMLASAIAQTLIALYVAVVGLDELYIALLIGLFALPWLLSAGLFQAAARQHMLARG